MSPDEAGKLLVSKVAVRREDIARAKSYILQAGHPNTNAMAQNWLAEQHLDERNEVDTDAPDCPDVLAALARAYSVRIALYTAVWELAAAGRLFPSHPPMEWRPALGYHTSHNAGAIPTLGIGCPYLPHVFPSPAIGGVPRDLDIFLAGLPSTSLHSGIIEAIEQSLECFKRGLYIPAIVMLAAAAEATWTECGLAVARKLGIGKLESTINDPRVSISKKVTNTRQALEQSAGNAILKTIGHGMSQLLDVELWTTVLRDRRNALHWGKAKGLLTTATQRLYLWRLRCREPRTHRCQVGVLPGSTRSLPTTFVSRVARRF